jgi:ribosome-associated protein
VARKQTKPPSKTAGAAEPDDGSAFACLIAGALIDVKAEDVVVVDVRGLTDVADLLVIATSLGDRQLGAMADAAEDAIKGVGRTLIGIGGESGSGWMVVDTGDVVTHLLTRAMREYYDLDGLWADATRVEIPAQNGRGAS